jgi:RNA 2',3'-cyclic 3'-phosphodiesterase
MTGDEREGGGPGLTRAFIAVTIPDGIKNQLGGVQSKLKRADADVKWTRPHGIHITLRFMGWLNQDDLEKTRQAVAEAVKGFSEFEVEVKGVGTFPERGRPRVVWVGLSRGEKELAQVAARLEQELVKRGMGEADRAFRGHLTLGRIKTGKNLDKLVEYLNGETDMSWGDFPAKSICLIKSDLQRDGAIYTVLQEEFFRT